MGRAALPRAPGGALGAAARRDRLRGDDRPAAALRARLAAAFTLAAPPVLATTRADDGATRKVLLDLGGGAAVEAVRMAYDPEEPGPRSGRATVCVSTQVGCAMGCVFCATGQQGFTRNLTPAEIVEQVLHFARSERVTNVVFMGMGEPLANYDATLAAIRWLIDADGLDMRAARHDGLDRRAARGHRRLAAGGPAGRADDLAARARRRAAAHGSSPPPAAPRSTSS